MEFPNKSKLDWLKNKLNQVISISDREITKHTNDVTFEFFLKKRYFFERGNLSF